MGEPVGPVCDEPDQRDAGGAEADDDHEEVALPGAGQGKQDQRRRGDDDRAAEVALREDEAEQQRPAR